MEAGSLRLRFSLFALNMLCFLDFGKFELSLSFLTDPDIKVHKKCLDHARHSLNWEKAAACRHLPSTGSCSSSPSVKRVLASVLEQP